MTPQINMDIIPVDIMYGNKEKGDEGLISSIYSSDWKKACEIAVQNSQLNIKDDPMKRKFEKKDLIEKSLEKTHFKADNAIPPMEIGLDKYISAWDKQYPVEFVDTTKLFWEKHKETGLCPSCECQDSVKGLTDEETTELDNCLKEDALRTPFTLHPPGIQFRKKKFTKYDPFVTTLMTSQGVYDKYSI
ncbi:uncharacterized protein LOC129910944 isoform X2 [Episyrphus balteatus]|uniref:uncharacterized protein LOC129910944 isoform X2 n=1 Tax=Episyrphus balteatus TaxID=286459 RepID=UPI0024853342|nr:uncharacterized protein LOC129910944 isoform X2 [Episyrphus balteatus]